MELADEPLFLELVNQVVGHGELLGGDEVELRAEVAECLGEGVDGAAVLQVADEGDAEVVQASLGLEDGEEIKQRLGGVLVGAVSRVDDRNL